MRGVDHRITYQRGLIRPHVFHSHGLHHVKDGPLQGWVGIKPVRLEVVQDTVTRQKIVKPFRARINAHALRGVVKNGLKTVAERDALWLHFARHGGHVDRRILGPDVDADADNTVCVDDQITAGATRVGEAGEPLQPRGHGTDGIEPVLDRAPEERVLAIVAGLSMENLNLRQTGDRPFGTGDATADDPRRDGKIGTRDAALGARADNETIIVNARRVIQNPITFGKDKVVAVRSARIENKIVEVVQATGAVQKRALTGGGIAGLSDDLVEVVDRTRHRVVLTRQFAEIYRTCSSRRIQQECLAHTARSFLVAHHHPGVVHTKSAALG